MFPTAEYPAVSDVIVYYVTHVVGVPIFVDTDLKWFRTPKFAQWIKESNLPGHYLNIMRGTLQENYGCRIPLNVAIELPATEIAKIERWISSWKEETFLRRYTMAIRNNPEFLEN